MQSVWIVIALVSLFAAVFLFYYSREPAGITEQDDAKHTAVNFNKVLAFLPFFAIALSPIAYLNWPSYQKQSNWQSVIQQTQSLKTNGEPSNLNMSMQDFVLALRTLAHHNPQKGDIWFELGGAYLQLGMEDAAIASWQRAIRVEKQPDWMVALAQILGSKNDKAQRNEALNILNQALTINPNHQAAMLTLGFTLFKGAQYDAAIQAWERLKKSGLSVQSEEFVNQQIQMAKDASIKSAE